MKNEDLLFPAPAGWRPLWCSHFPCSPIPRLPPLVPLLFNKWNGIRLFFCFYSNRRQFDCIELNIFDGQNRNRIIFESFQLNAWAILRWKNKSLVSITANYLFLFDAYARVWLCAVQCRWTIDSNWYALVLRPFAVSAYSLLAEQSSTML